VHARLAVALLAFCLSTVAAAQVKIGLMVSATGPTTAIGMPQKNTGDLLPRKIGDVTIEYIQYDDGGDQSAPPAQQRGGPRARQEVKDDGSPATESQLKLIRVKMEQAGLSTEDMKKKLGYDLTGLTKAKVNTVLDWIRNPVA